MKQISIQREIETDGAYGCRQTIVEVNATFVRELQNTTDTHPPVYHDYLDSFEILDDSGHDITETLHPDIVRKLEKQAWDAR